MVLDWLRHGRTLEESGFFRGFTDWHSHLLYGVDDGVRTLEESLAILGEWDRLGVKGVWCTPHVMEDVPNTVEGLRQRFGALQSAYTGPVELHLGSENMLDALFRKRLERDELLPLSDGLLLVETSVYGSPFDLEKLFRDIQKKGYTPLLAHPERYRYMEKEDYRRYHGMGVCYQLNLLSLGGFYGGVAREKAMELLDRGWYTVAGTDLHNRVMLAKAGGMKLKKKVLEQLEQLEEQKSF